MLNEPKNPPLDGASQQRPPAKWWWNRRYANIVLVSTGFMLVSTSWFTTSAIANNVISDMKHYGFHDRDGYIAQAIMCGAQTVLMSFTPLVAATIGCKWTVIVGGCGHLLFVGSFLFHSRMLIFITAVIVGFCMGCYWVGVGLVLAINTDPETADKGWATFWVLYNCGQIWGNIFVAIKFNDVVFIDDSLRIMTFSILFGTAVVGIIVLLFIKLPPTTAQQSSVTVGLISAKTSVGSETLKHRAVDAQQYSHVEQTQHKNVIARLFTRLRPSLALAISPLMLASLGYFGFAGINVIIMVSPIPTSIGFNQHLGTGRKRLMGVTGFCMGAAEIVGGLAIVAAIGSGYVRRVHIYIMGTTMSAIAIIFSVLNAPLDATLNESSKPSILFGDGASSSLISIACAILFGISDAATNITMLALVSDVFGHEHDDETIEPSKVQTTTTRLTPSANLAFESENNPTNNFSSYDAIESVAVEVRRRKSFLSTSENNNNTRKFSVASGHPPHILIPPPNNVPDVVKLQREQATATANAVLNGIQAAMQASMMVLSSYLLFYWYLVILIPCGIWASISFYIIDRNYRAGKYKDRFRA